MKLWIILMTLGVLAYADKLYTLQYKGVDSVHLNAKEYHIEREIHSNCQAVPILISAIWEGDFAGEEVPSECKASFVKTAGVISPMKITDGVETYGELEVMLFIRRMQHKDSDHLLVDSRRSDWHEYETIPGAINIWAKEFTKPDVFPEEYAQILKLIGIKSSKKGTYDFSNAKTLVVFCNGPWCVLSPKFIKGLLKLGYPAEKLKWYRGGMHDWKSLSMTTTLSAGAIVKDVK